MKKDNEKKEKNILEVIDGILGAISDIIEDVKEDLIDEECEKNESCDNCPMADECLPFDEVCEDDEEDDKEEEEKVEELRIPGIKKIRFSNPYTYISWADGEESMFRCKKPDKYNEFDSFCSAIVQKMFGSIDKANDYINERLADDDDGIDDVLKMILDFLKGDEE